MHKKQSGFSHLLILLFILLLTIVGFAGWRILNEDKSFSGEPAVVPQLTEAHIDFGIDILNEIATDDQANYIISPTNISIALSMLYAGSDGESQSAIQQGLRIGDMSIDDVNTQTQSLVASLQEESDQELHIANALWTVNNFEPEPNYVDMTQEYYDSTVDTGDVSKVNNWASDNTNGKIPTIIKEIDDSLRLLITSALYFNGTWKTEFNESYTVPREFTSRTGNTEEIETMYLGSDMDYTATNDIQAVSLPYGENEIYRMLVVLPKDMDTYLTNFDSSQYRQILGSVQNKAGILYLPKFKEKLSYDLKPSLTALGMGNIFTNRNEFKAIGDNLFVDFVQHDIFMDLNESGTEAAATTSIGMTTTSINPTDYEDPFVMNVNRPFFISLYQSDSGEPLFMGIMNNPDL
jgi:serine protease inhibitor